MSRNLSPPHAITLVLGGGGFKGVAHLGVLRVLQQAGVPVERVIGTSVGALVGGSYCYLRDAEATHSLLMNFLQSEGLRAQRLVGLRRRAGGIPLLRRLVHGIRRQVALERMFRRSSAFGNSALRFIVRNVVPHVDIADLPLPLGVGALDLLSGEEVLLTHGDLGLAVAASSAVPGFFPPVEWNGMLLCDAGIVNNLPAEGVRRLGARAVVAVDLSSGLSPCRQDASGIEVLLRAQDISTRIANRRCSESADVVVVPELDGRHWLDTSNLPEVVEAGAVAARRALPAILALVNGVTREAS
jgi:NTE family protein